MDRITDNLYIGDIHDAGNTEWLRDGSPTAVLKLLHGDPPEPYPESITVRDRPLIDGPQNEYDDFQRATRTLLELLEADHVVFVHCAAGASRSVSVATAALAVRHDLEIDATLEAIRNRRPVANPHPHLLEQAERFRGEY